MPRSPLLLLLSVFLVGGCSKPFSAESNLRLTEAERRERHVLSHAAQREAIAAMRLVADGHERSGSAPAQAAGGMRWRDVPLAVRLACEEVDMAVVRMRGGEDEKTFRLITLDERPAELIVRRIDDGRVYEATATVGRFADDTDRAARLIQALRRNLLALGSKRALND